MKISSISAQVKNPNRVNVSVDGKYRFSLDVAQLVDLGIKQGQEIDEATLTKYSQESEFGKLYARALEYCLMRPHSAREVRDYLRKKTQVTKYRSKKTGEIKERSGVDQDMADRVYDRLQQRGYIDDEKFARYWMDNRNQIKGASRRKLAAELRAKGVSGYIIKSAMAHSGRSDDDEIAKIIAKKRARYSDEQKLMAYLARQGFNYDDIRSALDRID